MHLVKSLLVVALAAPLVVAGPRGNGLHRRTGDDDKDSSSSSLTTTVLTLSSSVFAKGQPSMTLIGTAPLGTGISSALGTTQEVVITDVVYTTLTTCPVTSLVTSGSESFEEITTTISTVTRTSTSTLCTKCVAPPSKPAMFASSPGETAVSVLPSFTIYSLSQPLLSLPSTSTSSMAGAIGTGGLSAILFPNIIPVIPLQTAVSSKPEISGTAASPSRSVVFPSIVSLTVSATSGTLEFPGYGIVLSPTSAPGSPREETFPNTTSSIIPVYTAALLGNAYGGGFIRTPSVYVTRLPYPNGPSGVPPGYGSESSITIISNNATTVPMGLEASSTSAGGLETTTEIGVPAFSATIASNVSVLIGSPSVSSISATVSKNESSTPTFISLSPFGGKVGHESGSTALPIVISLEIPSSPGSSVIGIEASLASSATASAQTGNAESAGTNVVTALIEATSPAVALSAEISQVSNVVLSSLAANGLPTSSVNVQVAIVGSSTTSVFGSSGETVESRLPNSTPIGGSAMLATVAIASLAVAGVSSFQGITAAESAGSSPTSAIGLAGMVEVSFIPTTTVTGFGLSPTFSSSGVNNKATPAGSSTSGEIGTIIISSVPGEENTGPLITLAGGSSVEQTPTAGQATASMLTSIIVANGATALAVIQSPAVGANGQTSAAIQPTISVSTPIVGVNGLIPIAAISSPAISANGQALAAGQSTTSMPTPIIVANGITVLASPVVEVNGQTLAASQPAASTPIIVANGATALAVIPYPVVSANGQTLAAVQPAAPLVTIAVNGATTLAVIPSSIVSVNGLIPLAILSTPTSPAAGLTTPAVLTPVVGANGLTSLAVAATPVVGLNGQVSAAGELAASVPIIVANGATALAVIPSPIVGANGLTSLAVFSTPIAPAAGLTTPAVLLTPIVGANGLTSLAVVATPVVGANGLTSLAIGFETETTPAAGQPSSALTPIEGSIFVQPPTFTPQASGGIYNQANTASFGMTNVILPSGSAESPTSGGSGSGNYSIHFPLNPTAVAHFQGSAFRLSLGFGGGLFGLMAFLVLL